MVLSDRSIKEAIEAGTIRIEPYSPRDVQPASVDFHLANKILVFRRKQLRNLTRKVNVASSLVAAGFARIIFLTMFPS